MPPHSAGKKNLDMLVLTAFSPRPTPLSSNSSLSVCLTAQVALLLPYIPLRPWVPRAKSCLIYVSSLATVPTTMLCGMREGPTKHLSTCRVGHHPLFLLFVPKIECRTLCLGCPCIIISHKPLLQLSIISSHLPGDLDVLSSYMQLSKTKN